MFECPNGCGELLTLYQAERGLYWGCPECSYMGSPLTEQPAPEPYDGHDDLDFGDTAPGD